MAIGFLECHKGTRTTRCCATKGVVCVCVCFCVVNGGVEVEGGKGVHCTCVLN